MRNKSFKMTINFFFKKDAYKSLSNFWECNLIVGSREYDSGEHCFHGEKFIRIGELCTDEVRKQALLEYSHKFLKGPDKKNGSVIKKMGRKFVLTPTELELWRKISIDVQIDICKYKYEHYDIVREDLKKSRGNILIHPAMRCSDEKVKNRQWEGRAILVDGQVTIIGKNMLGKIWMFLRDN